MQENRDFFEEIYAQSQRDEKQIPWASMQVNEHLKQYIQENPVRGKALVIGCGLGDDAKALELAGYQVTAFDLSVTAIDWCKERFKDSTINFLAADLFDLPDTLLEGFDFVFEARTIQSIPTSLRTQTIEAMAATLKPNGKILVLANGRHENEQIVGPPWPLLAKELASFEDLEFKKLKFDTFETVYQNKAGLLFLALYQKN